MDSTTPFKLRNDFFTHHKFHPKKKSDPDPLIIVFYELFKKIGWTMFRFGSLFLVGSYVICFTCLLGFIISIILFPFYFRLFSKNRPNEKSLPLYPIIQHFYRYVCLYILLIVVFIFHCILASFLHSDRYDMFFPYFFITTITSPVFNILLIILAVQRFTIYFLPNYEIGFGQKTWTAAIFILYLIVILINGGLVIAKIEWTAENFTVWSAEKLEIDGGIVVSLDEMYIQFSFFLEALSVISTFIYIPIFISVTNKVNIASVISSKPELYIFFQALSINLLKLPTIYLIVHLFILRYDSIGELREVFVLQNASNFFTVPFVTELTYILCNKRNVKAVISFVNPWNLFCRNCRRNYAVGPTERETTI
ncbi:CRE-SRZ-6 protein [Caenorhabditis remanei]|uniref:CRE-SRZ-6 protein n=1 Tax=Caenorhabditis remanei TaxID=31234 RepID=E3MIX8_CAERE|nr:CRE-SRZ-6 protein [Caenorhabditis remanei]